jgi:hypothetical protein
VKGYASAEASVAICSFFFGISLESGDYDGRNEPVVRESVSRSPSSHFRPETEMHFLERTITAIGTSCECESVTSGNVVGLIISGFLGSSGDANAPRCTTNPIHAHFIFSCPITTDHRLPIRVTENCTLVAVHSPALSLNLVAPQLHTVLAKRD